MRPAIKLLMVTDTPFINKDGEIQVFEPVFREVLNFKHLFSNITWIGYDFTRSGKYFTFTTIDENKIDLILLKRTGGEGIKNKLIHILRAIPYMMIIMKNIKTHDLIHSRGPSYPAFLTIIASLFFKDKKFWHKYAGNWNQKTPPTSYYLQMLLLKKAIKNNSIATINGKWPNQKYNILSFENPSLTLNELEEAKLKFHKKNYDGKLNFCFVGRMEEAKGVERVIKALKLIHNYSGIDYFYFVGDGPEISNYKLQANQIDHDNIVFCGSLDRSQLNDIYEKCHAILLPTSASEGFPKVIAEAMAYGCIPVVSNISSIDQYVTKKNGFILKMLDPSSLMETIKKILLNRDELKKKARSCINLAKVFSYEAYNKKILKMILKNDFKYTKS